MDEKPAKILAVLFDTVIKPFDIRLLQKTFHLLLKLSATLTGNYLHFGNTLFNSFINYVAQGLLNRPAVIVQVMQIKLKLCHGILSKINNSRFW